MDSGKLGGLNQGTKITITEGHTAGMGAPMTRRPPLWIVLQVTLYPIKPLGKYPGTAEPLGHIPKNDCGCHVPRIV